MKIAEAALQLTVRIYEKAKANIARITKGTTTLFADIQKDKLDLQKLDKQANAELQRFMATQPEEKHTSICINTLGFVAASARTIRDFNLSQVPPSKRLRYGIRSLIEYAQENEQ